MTHVDIIRRAAKTMRDELPDTFLALEVAPRLEAAADREAAYLAAPYGDGHVQPGEEVHLAWSIAAAYLGEDAPQ